MNWAEAVGYMSVSGMVTRKHWLKDDFLYMKNGILFDDGGNRYLDRLTCTHGKWYPYYMTGLRPVNHAKAS